MKKLVFTCDACGGPCETCQPSAMVWSSTEAVHRVSLYKEGVADRTLDLCEACYDKMCKALGIDTEKSEDSEVQQ